MVVDLQNGFTDPACPVGGELGDVISASATLLAECRRRELPVAFTAVGFDAAERDVLPWLRKMPGLKALEAGTHWCEIDQRVAPEPGEPVYVKRASSAFFGTPLLTFLTSRRVDTLVVVGCVTSGCVRATTIDAVSHGFRTIVPEECVGDRAEVPTPRTCSTSTRSTRTCCPWTRCWSRSTAAEAEAVAPDGAVTRPRMIGP